MNSVTGRAMPRLLAAILGVFAMALASQVEIPLVPVPLTMQSFAVMTAGGLLGWRLGGMTMIAWLILGALGAPVFADGGAGLDHLTGPTAGYLLAFPLAAMQVGWLTERAAGASILRLCWIMILGHALCLVLGAGG